MTLNGEGYIIHPCARKWSLFSGRFGELFFPQSSQDFVTVSVAERKRGKSFFVVIFVPKCESAKKLLFCETGVVSVIMIMMLR